MAEAATMKSAAVLTLRQHAMAFCRQGSGLSAATKYVGLHVDLVRRMHDETGAVMSCI